MGSMDTTLLSPYHTNQLRALMLNIRLGFVISFTVIALTACKPTPQPVAENSAPATISPAEIVQDVAVVAEQSHSGDTLLWADPLPACEKNQTAHIYWSNDALVGGAARIELGDGDNPSVFARIGKAGDKETGPWAGPGTTFVLRGDLDGVERSRLILPKPQHCN